MGFGEFVNYGGAISSGYLFYFVNQLERCLQVSENKHLLFTGFVFNQKQSFNLFYFKK